MRPSSSSRVVRVPMRGLALAMLAAATVACSSGEPAAAPESVPPAAAPSASTAPPAAATPSDDLAAKAQQAVAENRIYAPAGDNAIEFYLAQRERAVPGDSGAEAALIELQPYAMMAAEQAIAATEFTEAERLIALMVRIDATAPSLARLQADLDAAREAQAAALAEALAKAQAEAEAVTPTPPTPAPVAAAPTPRPTAPARAPTATPPARPATPAPPTATVPPAPRPASSRTPAAPGPLVPVSTPFPPFPSEAIARGRAMGSVTVRFTVRANGRVTDIQVIEARPEGLFERTVIETLGDWRFEPGAGDRTETRTFSFRN